MNFNLVEFDDPLPSAHDSGVIVSRYKSFLCSYQFHQWTFWRIGIPDHLSKNHLQQKRNCVACGKIEITPVYTARR